MNLVSLARVSKGYQGPQGEVLAVSDVNLDLKRQDSLAIMGPSGSGKSTLLHLIGLLDVPTSGTLRFDGEDVAGLADEALSRIRSEKIGFVFQAFHLIPQLTILENVELPFTYRKKRRSSKQRAAEALEKVGLKERMTHRPQQLSGGQQQRVAIARAIVGDPLLLLADEPTGNLDEKNSEEILDLFQALGDQGTALVTITHNPEVGKWFKRIASMKNGKIYASK